jgi:hypothetical protein
LQYAAKVVEGRSQGDVVAPGEYWTAVNVHNPGLHVARFRFKVAVALPRKAGPVSPFQPLRLRSDEALEIDWKTILELVAEKFVKGFVVLESPTELDVVAVYTAAPEKGMETIHVERVFQQANSTRTRADHGARRARRARRAGTPILRRSTTRLHLHELQTKPAKLASVGRADRNVADHRMTRPTRSRRLDLTLHDRSRASFVFEVAFHHLCHVPVSPDQNGILHIEKELNDSGHY